MLLKEMCPELSAEVDSIWTRVRAHRHTHIYKSVDETMVSFFRPFCSWPIINCQARQRGGVLLKPQTDQQLCWSERRHMLVLLVELFFCEIMKSQADTRLKAADVWLCCGTDLNTSVWTGKNHTKSDFCSFRQSHQRIPVTQEQNRHFDAMWATSAGCFLSSSTEIWDRDHSTQMWSILFLCTSLQSVD